MKLQFGSEPTIEDYEALVRERDELLAQHDVCDNELKSAREISGKYLAEHLEQLQKVRDNFDTIKAEVGELTVCLAGKSDDFAEIVDSGISYRIHCDKEFSKYYDGESLSTDDKLALLKCDISELIKEKAASAESAAIASLLSDVNELSVKITGYQEASPITSGMVSEGLRGIKELDDKAKSKFTEVYRNRGSELRLAIDNCWTLAKELGDMCSKPSSSFKPKKVSNFGRVLQEACDNESKVR